MKWNKRFVGIGQSRSSPQDYTAKVYLDLRDPGKAYPALSTCIARELTGVSQATWLHQGESRIEESATGTVSTRTNQQRRKKRKALTGPYRPLQARATCFWFTSFFRLPNR